MRFDRLFFTVIAVPLDFAVLFVAGLTAWMLRLSESVQAVRPIIFDIEFTEYTSLVATAALFTVAVIAVMGLYKFPKPEMGPFGVTLRLILATSVTLSAVALAVFFRQELFGSRFLVFAGWILASIFLIGERTFLYFIEQSLQKHFAIGLRKTILVGGGDEAERLLMILRRSPALGFSVVHQINETDAFLVKEFSARLGIEAVLLTEADSFPEQTKEIIDFCTEEHIAVLFVPNVVQSLTANATASVFGGIPVVELRRTALEGWGRVFKRMLDIVGSFFGIILFSIPMLAIAIAVKAEDRDGPVIYRNRRAGQHGKPFDTLKFRSMYWRYSTGEGTPDPKGAIEFEKKLAEKKSERKGPVWKILDDPRRTRVGQVMEKISFDELPQFFNVLFGEMSLVGPRPHMLEQVAEYEAHHRRVLLIKPGITGLAQISGRSDLDFEDEVRLDTHYIENWSPWLDIKIILLTPFIIFFRRHRN